MGMRSAVRLAAWIPAMRATSSGLPLGFEGRAARTAVESSTKADAVAVRCVDCFPLTSTMEAWPDAAKCERGLRAGCERREVLRCEDFEREDLGIGVLREAECGRASLREDDQRLQGRPGNSWREPWRRDRPILARERARLQGSGRQSCRQRGENG